MFKRLFLLSGIIAFALAVLTIYFWYIPAQEAKQRQMHEQEIATPDTVKSEPISDYTE